VVVVGGTVVVEVGGMVTTGRAEDTVDDVPNCVTVVEVADEEEPPQPAATAPPATRTTAAIARPAHR
jgi:hypothetical protein